MKNLLFVSTLFGILSIYSTSLFAKSEYGFKEIDIKTISWNTKQRIGLYCVDGYVFVYAWGVGSGITQFFKREGVKSIPMSCSDMLYKSE